MYRSFHSAPDAPKSCVLSADGMMLEATSAVRVTVSVAASPRTVFPVAVKLVNVPAAAEFAPIVVPSIAPLSMSTLLISTSPAPFGVKAMLPSVSVLMMVLPLMLMLSTSRSPVTLAAPVIVRVAVSMVTAVAASMSTVGATSSNSVSASMSSCPSPVEPIVKAESRNCNSIAALRRRPVSATCVRFTSSSAPKFKTAASERRNTSCGAITLSSCRVRAVVRASALPVWKTSFTSSPPVSSRLSTTTASIFATSTPDCCVSKVSKTIEPTLSAASMSVDVLVRVMTGASFLRTFRLTRYALFHR